LILPSVVLVQRTAAWRRRRAIEAGDVSLVGYARLLGNAAEPLATVAHDHDSGFDAGASWGMFRA
jgi:hypothetical protein